MLISDSVEVRNPANGQMYSSKSRYYADVKAMGCEIVGNDTSVIKDRPTYQADDAAIERDVVQTMKESGLI